MRTYGLFRKEMLTDKDDPNECTLVYSGRGLLYGGYWAALLGHS